VLWNYDVIAHTRKSHLGAPTTETLGSLYAKGALGLVMAGMVDCFRRSPAD